MESDETARERRGANAVRWLRRYGPAEIAGIAGALLAAAATHRFGVPALTATSAALAESIGFYAVILVRDLRARSRQNHHTAVGALRDLLVEFGPAEALDTLLVRPLAMYGGATITGNVAVGVLLGKLVADVAFYSVAIVGHELVRAFHAKRSGARASTTDRGRAMRSARDDVVEPVEVG